MPSNPLEPAPLVSPTQTVIEDWIDYNGHLNMAFYNVIFDRAVDHFYDLIGVGAQYAGSGVGSCFTMEIHVHCLNEVSLGDELDLHLQLLDYRAAAPTAKVRQKTNPMTVGRRKAIEFSST